MMMKQRISSYDANQLDDIVIDDDDRSSSGNSSNNNCNNNSSDNKLIEFICKFIHVFSTIIKFCFPLIITIAILSYDSYVIGAIVGFGLVSSKILVLDLFLYKMRKIQSWPNKIDMIASAVYASFLLERMQFQSHIVLRVDIIVYGILTASIGVAWLFGYPIGRAIVSEKVGDMVPFNHPVVIHFIQLTSGVMMCTFSSNFMLSIVAAVDYNHGEKEKALAFKLACCILLNDTAVYIFISVYGFHFNTNIEKIAANYEKEISKQMDNHKHHHPNNISSSQ